MRACLIANSTDADSGFVGDALGQRGYSFESFIREDYRNWPTLEGIELVVSLGSNWSTYWDHLSGPILAEQKLLADAIAGDIAVLGICFGAQQLSTVLGGQVTKAQSPEIGWHKIIPVADSGHLISEEIIVGPWMQWHYDRFTVPPGATVLAKSDVGPQMFVCGKSVGVQFHPEATVNIVEMWSEGDGAKELTSAQISVEFLRAQTEAETQAEIDSSAQRCHALIEWFLDCVAQKHITT